MTYDPYAPPSAGAPPRPDGAPHGSAHQGWGAWSPPPPRRSRTRLWIIGTVATLGSLVLMALVALVGVGVVLDRREQRLDPGTVARVEAEVPRLQEWITRERGLRFTSPVDVEVLAGREFEDALDVGEGDQPLASDDDAYDYGATFDALGLVDSGQRLYDVQDELISDAVLGFYDSTDSRLVVRGARWSPHLELTLLHELVHAAQDQAYDLTALTEASRADDESSLALRSLIEGDATEVERRYYEDQTASWQAEVDGGARTDDDLSREERLARSLSAVPYYWGEYFVAEIRTEGDALERAFETPPVTTEELNRPDDWVDGRDDLVPMLPSPPTARDGADPVDRGVLGVVGLALLGSDGDLEEADPEAFHGWSGDRFTTWYSGENETHPCISVTAVFDDAESRDEALDSLRGWADRDGTSAEATGAVGIALDACG